MCNIFTKHWRWLAPLLLLLIYAPWSGALDLKISQFFYHPHEVGDNRFVSTSFVWFLFDWGPAPAWIASLLCITVLLLSLVIPSLVPWRKAATIPLLVFALGSGLIIHAVFKDHWGRPRPRQVVQFGGEQQFRPFYEPEFRNPTPSKSFSCGHCSTGFFFFAFALIGQRMRKRWMEWGGYFLAFLLGGLLSYSRVAQGAHFFSDVLLSGLIMWWISLIVCWAIFPKEEIPCTD